MKDCGGKKPQEKPQENIIWPARHVAEYAYCPRLFFYMQVEGVFIPSSDTVKGSLVHRRVDKPSASVQESHEADQNKPQVVRSLTLTSQTLGLTAKLDLVEIAGNKATPIEYRKGRPRRTPIAVSADSPAEIDQPHGSETSTRPVVDDSLTADFYEEVNEPPLFHPQPWPSDRVQVGIQVILLEDAGYVVEQAVLYYAAEKYRLNVQVDDALRRDALEVLESAKRCAQGLRPPPLVNDPKCPRCSLQPICLPDEVNFQKAVADEDDTQAKQSPRKLWPPRDDGIHVVAQKNAAKIGVRGQELRVTDKDGLLVKTMPLVNVESISLLGSVQISTQAVQVLADKKTPIAYLSAAGRLIAMIDPMDLVSSNIRKAQFRRLEDPQIRLELAQALVTAKIHNQRTLLMRNHNSLPDTVINDMNQEARRVMRAETVDAVRGHEGRAAALYFKYFSAMFKTPLAEEFDNNGRARRPPPDPINACLSLSYSMLTHECVTALRLARLEPTIGGLHATKFSRPALALDLMEPFRPLISDSLAISCFNRGELREGHFQRTSVGCMLTDSGRRNFFNALGRRMDASVTHPVFKYRLSYRRMIVLHARMIAAWLIEDIPSLSFLTTR